MEMGSNANVDDSTFRDIALAASLPESCRPQVNSVETLACVHAYLCVCTSSFVAKLDLTAYEIDE